MLEIIENKINDAIKKKKYNKIFLISSIISVPVSVILMFIFTYYFLLFPILPFSYYYYRKVTYKKQIDYIPIFLESYSRLKEKTNLGKDNLKDENIDVKTSTRTILKTIIKKVPIIKKVVEKVEVEKIVYKDKIVKVPVEVDKIINNYKDKIIYKDKIVKVPVIEKVYINNTDTNIEEKIDYNSSKYEKKKNIYEDNELFNEIENILSSRFYSTPVSDRSKIIYSLINSKNVERKKSYEHIKIKD